jgi:hypothetical protein
VGGERSRLQLLFDCYDEDGTGTVTEDELLALVEARQLEMVDYHDLIASVIATVDASGDGLVDYHELLAATETEPVLLDAIAAVLPNPPEMLNVVAFLQQRAHFDWER